MPRLDTETAVIIETQPDGRYTFQVKFKGTNGPKSRPMAKREDAELLGNLLVKKLQQSFRRQLSAAE